MLLYLVFALFLVIPLVGHIRKTRAKEAAARAAAERGRHFSDGPKAQHPHIDVSYCIGCGACTVVCPEGDVLAVVGGKAAIVHGHKCIGHGLCAEACPVGAIEIVMAPPSVSADLPALSPEFETSVPGLYVVGELGGLALIKNAVNQGRDCVDRHRRPSEPATPPPRSRPGGCRRRRRRPGRTLRLTPRHREEAHLRHLRAGKPGRDRGPVPAPEAGDDQSGRVPDARQVQEARAFQGGPARLLEGDFHRGGAQGQHA